MMTASRSSSPDNNTYGWGVINVWAAIQYPASGIWSDRGALVPAGGRLDVSCRPNPMKEAVSISYQIPRESRSRLAVYDITGRLVCQTPSIVAAPGKNHFTWNGRDARGCPVGNGIYIFRVEAEGRFGTARTALIR